MKKYRIAIIVLMLLSIVITGISFAFLNDIIPTHLNIKGAPDQFGSKYFAIMFPGIIIVIGTSILLTVKFAKSENYKKYLLLIGTLILGLFTILMILYLAYALIYKEDKTQFDISKIIRVSFGLLFIVMGNFMPKVEKNKTLGFKTRWALYNEVTWQKTQRFSGYAGIIIGLLAIVSGLFFEYEVNFIILMSLVLIMVTSTTIASYKYYKEEKAKS